MDKLSHESFEKDFQKITQVIQKEYTDLQNYIKKEKDLIKQ